ncbi:hypothetical protein [Haematomicrobium sanguinis]|uniref:hypothetical protein n=1 Tax=Haematomicrobium sanguinis TaxID=479106 RepID=UPI00047C9B22|nr:hypothetical protein [Haematomicrobium sanguinis]
MAENRRPKAQPKVSPAVYRRRRLVAGIAILVILALLVAGGIALAKMIGGNSAKNDGDASSQAQPTSSTGNQSGDPSAAAEDPPTADPNSCQPDKIEVSASTDAASYPADKNPVLTLTVKNNNSVDCTINVGTTQQEFQIFSGDDRIFSSADCQADPVDLEKTIPPGKSETANFTWERNRTAPGCQPVQAVPLPGTYKLTVRLGDIQSEPATFQLQ